MMYDLIFRDKIKYAFKVKLVSFFGQFLPPFHDIFDRISATEHRCQIRIQRQTDKGYVAGYSHFFYFWKFVLRINIKYE